MTCHLDRLCTPLLSNATGLANNRALVGPFYLGAHTGQYHKLWNWALKDADRGSCQRLQRPPPLPLGICRRKRNTTQFFPTLVSSNGSLVHWVGNLCLGIFPSSSHETNQTINRIGPWISHVLIKRESLRRTLIGREQHKNQIPF